MKGTVTGLWGGRRQTALAHENWMDPSLQQQKATLNILGNIYVRDLDGYRDLKPHTSSAHAWTWSAFVDDSHQRDARHSRFTGMTKVSQKTASSLYCTVLFLNFNLKIKQTSKLCMHQSRQALYARLHPPARRQYSIVLEVRWNLRSTMYFLTQASRSTSVLA